MKRKMIGISSAYLSGLFFASFFIDKYGFILLLPVSVILFAVAEVRKFSRVDLYIIVFSFLTAFTVNMKYTLGYYYGAMDFVGTKGSFSGKVVDYEVYGGDRASYIIKGVLNDRRTKIILYADELGADYGDTVTIENCVFSDIKGDYLFDSERYYKSQNIFLCVYEADDIDIEYNNSAKIRKALASFRKNMISKIRLAVGDETGGFLIGMIFGEKKYVDGNTKTAVYRSGIGHILAVSGLHISIISAVVMLIMQKLKVNKFISFGIVNLIFLLFTALAEYPASAVRAMIMLDIIYSASLFRRQNDSLNSIAVAVMIMSLANPYIVYNAGFLLSVSGTFGIAVFGQYMTEGVTDKTAKVLISGICTTICILPVSLYFYEETSLISPLTNIILIPMCTVAMIFGLLYTVTGGFLTFLLYTADILIRAVIFVSDKISSLSYLNFPRTDNIIPSVMIVSGIVTVFVYLYTESRRFTAVSVFLSAVICAVVFAVSGKTAYNNMTVAVMGRNNNAVVAVSYKGRTDIIDLSGHYRSAEYVRKYLMENGISRVETVILTKNTASQEVTYKTELQPFKMMDCFAVNGIDIYNGRLKILSDSEFTFNTDSYTVNYSGNMLSVYYCEQEIHFTEAKNSAVTGGLAVYYGNIGKNTERRTDSIYLDDMNNFRIILSADEKYIIRRLYGEN